MSFLLRYVLHFCIFSFLIQFVISTAFCSSFLNIFIHLVSGIASVFDNVRDNPDGFSVCSPVIHDTELPPDVTKFSGKLWLVLGVFLMATMLRMYATCQQLQAQAQAHAAAASGLLGHTELRLHMPPSIALASRGRLQGLRLQLALLDREFDDLDYETLRALDSDNVSTAPSMTEEEINALPVHKYRFSVPQKKRRIIQRRLETQKPQMMISPAVYAWSRLMLEMYFVACHACIRCV
ncbi:E3 ubiquitin-protein ligase sdir1 [Lathyrus oleraceus]|uniref:RING-type E3 ubiquitin transferase n=1 Tax=Pisum sativum TaxID=3888 RepID=A0A9D5BDD2_PEA|nr:E3 ubiquitin-protein ligase sdir1 [Pisum sativum]